MLLTRGRVCPLQLLLVLASGVIFGSESRGPPDHILLSKIRELLFRRLLRLAGLRLKYPNQPPHTILAMLTVKVRVRVRVTLRLEVYRQSVCLGVKTLETQDKRFLFPSWTFEVIVLMYQPLWREDGPVCYEYAWPLVKCTHRTYSMLLKNSCFCNMHTA
jgi:hypothetical protein